MAPSEFIELLARRRVLLAAEGETLKFRAPEDGLDEALREELRRHKPSLLAALANRPGYVQLCPLSYNQLSLFFLNQLEPESSAYNLALPMRLEGVIDHGRLEKALGALAARHQQLRTTYGHLSLDEQLLPCQFVAEDLAPCWVREDATAWNPDELRERVRAFYAAPLNLESGPPVRAALFRRSTLEHVFVVVFHHIAMDGWSLNQVLRELGVLYAQTGVTNSPAGSETQSEPAAEGPHRGGPDSGGARVIPLPTPALFTDYVIAQRERQTGPEAARQLGYWEQQLKPAAPPLDIRATKRRPPLRRSVGGTRYFSLEPAFMTRLGASAKDLGITTFAFLLASFQAFLMRQSQHFDLVLGVASQGRRELRFDATVGYFVNPLPVRSRRLGSMSFREHAQRTGAEFSRALDNRDAPFALVVERCGLARDPSRTPVFQALFNLMSRRTLGDVVDLLYRLPSIRPVSVGGLKATAYPIDQQEGQFDLTLECIETSEGCLGLFKYCTDLFNEEEAERLVQEYRAWLDRVLTDPNARLDERLERSGSGQAPTETLVVAATFTAEPLQEFLEFWFSRLDRTVEVGFAPFGRVFQELLDPRSSMRRNERGANAMLVRLDDLTGNQGGERPSPSGQSMDSGAAAAGRLQVNVDELVRAITGATASMAVPLIVVLCPSSPRLAWLYPEEKAIQERLVAELKRVERLYLVTPDQVAGWYPVQDVHEPLGEELGHIPYTRACFAAMGTVLARVLQAVKRRPIKALVLDCDGTLWDGVVGEDGAQGVRVELEQRCFQGWLLEQYEAGVLLCLASKNQEADVWEVFDRHPGMVLRREHIAFWRINWQPKSANLVELAGELNVGLDAMVFLDDNPVEREEVRAHCPTVFCPEVPTTWANRMPYLRHVWPLDRLRVTAEDRKRQDHYRSERGREELRRDAPSFSDFLENLELRVEIRAPQECELERVSQLTLRTNQFNTTGLRLDVPGLRQWRAQPGTSALVAKVSDRFGDYGLVGALLLQQQSKVLSVDAFLLSCRALGRGVEHRMAAQVGRTALEAGCAQVRIPLRRTERNEPARSFLKSVADSCGGVVEAEWALQVDSASLVELRFAPAPAPAGAPAAKDFAAPQDLQGEPPWRSIHLDIARDLCSAKAVLAAVDAVVVSQSSLSQGAAGASVIPPNGETERLVAAAWSRALGKTNVGRDVNFFDLGGNSLQMARVAIDLCKSHGLAVSIVDLFQHPTVAGLARFLDAQPGSRPSLGDSVSVGLRQREALQQAGSAGPFGRLRQARATGGAGKAAGF